jgi:hypothetical protein
MVLYQFNCPCVDFATYTLVTQGLAPYCIRFNQIVENPWDGHARSLHGEQILIKCNVGSLKASWSQVMEWNVEW